MRGYLKHSECNKEGEAGDEKADGARQRIRVGESHVIGINTQVPIKALEIEMQVAVHKYTANDESGRCLAEHLPPRQVPARLLELLFVVYCHRAGSPGLIEGSRILTT